MSDTIAAMITRKGITREKFAKHVGVSVRALYFITQGIVEPRNETIMRMASGLNTGPREIVQAIIVARRAAKHDVEHLENLLDYLTIYQPF